MDMQTNRRALLGAMALAPIAISAPAAALASTSAWDKAVAAHKAAEDTYKRFNAEVYNPALARIEATAPCPPMKFSVTAKNGKVATFELRAHRLDEWDDHSAPAFREGAAEQRRLWLAYKAAEEAEGIDAIDDESDRLVDAASDLWGNVILTPAPNLAAVAVAVKLDMLFGEKSRGVDRDHIDNWHSKFTDAISADVKRLGGLA